MSEYKLTFREKIRKFFGLHTKYFNDCDKLHREDGPASITKNGYQEWWANGKCHREDGPAIIRPSGYQVWVENGVIQRKDGPAIIRSDGGQEWYRNGKLHREDGPAVLWSDGSPQWYINDKEITDEVNQWFEECNLNYDDMEFEDKMALKFYIRGLSND